MSLFYHCLFPMCSIIADDNMLEIFSCTSSALLSPIPFSFFTMLSLCKA